MVVWVCHSVSQQSQCAAGAEELLCPCWDTALCRPKTDSSPCPSVLQAKLLYSCRTGWCLVRSTVLCFFFFFNPLDIVLSILGQDFFKLSTSLCFSKPLTLQLLSLVCICVPAWSAPCGRRKTRWREAHHMAQKFCVM